LSYFFADAAALCTAHCAGALVIGLDLGCGLLGYAGCFNHSFAAGRSESDETETDRAATADGGSNTTTEPPAGPASGSNTGGGLSSGESTNGGLGSGDNTGGEGRGPSSRPVVSEEVRFE